MKTLLLNFHGDCNLGLFGKASENFCILGKFVLEKDRRKIEKVLRVKVFKASVANTDLIGLFLALNSNGIILPKIVTEKEMKAFEKLKKEFDLNLEVLDSKYTALGNLILCNDKGAIISKLFKKKEKKLIEDCLGIKAEYGRVASLDIVGACGIATNKGCLLHRDVKESEAKKIEEVLGVKADIGTVNFGSPYVSSGLISNSKGAIIGDKTTGPEIVRITEALNLI